LLRLTRDQQKAQTRARLLEAAGSVFAQRGYHDASVEEVAEEAGFSKGAVYSNFASKEDLFAALLEQRCRRSLLELEAALDQERLTPARLRQLGDALSAQLRQDEQWTLLFMEFWTRSVRDPGLRPKFAAIWQEARAGLAGLIARHAEQAGVSLPVPPVQLASAAMALSNGLGLQLLADPDRVPSKSLGNALALLFPGVAALDGGTTDGGGGSGRSAAAARRSSGQFNQTETVGGGSRWRSIRFAGVK
jgi:AcrR family transcriptional regulator